MGWKILSCDQIKPPAGSVAEGGTAMAARAAACPAQPCPHIAACPAVAWTSHGCVYNTKGKLFACIIMRAY